MGTSLRHASATIKRPEEVAKISVFDRGFIFGDGIYEVSAVIGGKLVDCEAHLARLERMTFDLHRASRDVGSALAVRRARLQVRTCLQLGVNVEQR